MSYLSCLLLTVILDCGSSTISTTYMYAEGARLAWGVRGVRGVGVLGVLKEFGEELMGVEVGGESERPFVRGRDGWLE